MERRVCGCHADGSLIGTLFFGWRVAGLPFVPSYTLKAQVPSAANLVKGNEVRLGGTRVGVVDKITAVRHANGTVTAELGLKQPLIAWHKIRDIGRHGQR